MVKKTSAYNDTGDELSLETKNHLENLCTDYKSPSWMSLADRSPWGKAESREHDNEEVAS